MLPDDYLLSRLADILGEFVTGLINFISDYLFLVIAAGLIVKIGLGLICGRRPAFFLIILTVCCAGIAVATGRFFW